MLQFTLVAESLDSIPDNSYEPGYDNLMINETVEPREGKTKSLGRIEPTLDIGYELLATHLTLNYLIQLRNSNFFYKIRYCLTTGMDFDAK